jgi:hypothetical protein
MCILRVTYFDTAHLGLIQLVRTVLLHLYRIKCVLLPGIRYSSTLCLIETVIELAPSDFGYQCHRTAFVKDRVRDICEKKL